MKKGRFYSEIFSSDIQEILSHFLNESIQSVHQICEQYGPAEEDVRRYDVYYITTPTCRRILKRAGEREILNYETFLAERQLPVPFYYGKWVDENSVIWIMLEAVPGEDLRNITDSLALSAADSLAQIQNAFWQNVDDDRFDVYWNRILRRASFVQDDPLLGKAYQLFLNRQQTCPRTLSNGDFIPFNALQSPHGVIITDWGFGGGMPYSLDIARFTAHASETEGPFPFHMTDSQKKLFVDRVYDQLINPPDYKQYLKDIQLAVLNEYIEFMEADEDETGWYRDRAFRLATEIIKNKEVDPY